MHEKVSFLLNHNFASKFCGEIKITQGVPNRINTEVYCLGYS